MSGQTVQTQIKLLLEEHPSDVTIILVKSPCSNFRVITAFLSGIQMFCIFIALNYLNLETHEIMVLKLKH